MTLTRIVSIVSGLALATLLTGILQQRPAPGYYKVPFSLLGGVPATLYYQFPPGAAPEARPGFDRPPANAGVVIAHGYSADRNTMEVLSESLAHAGYTVLSLDLSGHGTNHKPLGGSDELAGDIRAGVQFLQQKYGFEPAKIAVLGHSMGARATVDYGSREPGVGALIMLGGGTDNLGPVRPRNALFLYAEHELPGIERSVRTTVATLVGTDKVEQRRTYGDLAAGTGVRIAQIPGVVHGSIMGSPVAFAEIIGWLDAVTGFPPRATAPAIGRHPVGPPLLWFSFLLVLPGLGLLLGRLAPESVQPARAGRWTDFAVIVLALLLPLPFLALGRPGVLMGASHADGNVTHLALAGVLLLVSLILSGRLRGVVTRVPSALAVAAAGWLAVGVLLAPASAYFHGVGLAPEKAFLALWSAACLTPFALSLQCLLYRPRWWRGTLLRIAARVAILAALAAGNALGVFGFPGTIATFVLLATPFIVEPVLAGFYGRSRNVLAAAGFDALVTGWLFALYLPTVM